MSGMSWTPILALLSVVLAYTLIFFYPKLHRHDTRHLPPGPPALPLLGNLFSTPRIRPWIGYRELSEKYGNLMHFRVLGRSLIIVNDAKTAMDLLEKRSGIYSSRPSSVLTKLAGWEWNMVFFPYGTSWRQYRRLSRKHFHPDVIPKYYEAQTRAARRLLVRSMSHPATLSENSRCAVGMTLVTTTYGLEVGDDMSDKYLSAVEIGVKSIQLFLLGTSVLELVPILSHIPTWVPGAGYLRELVEIRRATHRLRDLPWDDAREAVLNRHANCRESILSAMMEEYSHLKGDAFASEEEVARNVAAVSYAAGIDTTGGIMGNFCVAMSLYTDVQKAAQAELDAVVGPHRFPEFSDRENLPYINALVKEILRWNPVTPLGFAHLNTSDDQYNEYFIPGGSTVMVNVWSILNDPQVYPEPEKFAPGRFLKDGKLNPEIRDPAAFLFGFGRRICPGRHFADAILFIQIASILHSFSIGPPLDASGSPIYIEPRMSDGLVSQIEDCRCTALPRSAEAEALIRSFGAE